MTGQRIFVFALLLVYIGLPALHMAVIGPHGHAYSSVFGHPPAAHHLQVSPPYGAPESKGTQDDHPAPKTQPISHCDLGVNPADNPPSFVFDLPRYVGARDERSNASPLSFTVDPPSLPPRQA